MGAVLFAWELGAGLGHVVKMGRLATDLAAKGHRVYVALRDLSQASTVFARTRVLLLQAPYRLGPMAPIFNPTLNFAHIMHNVGFGDPGSLAAHASAWRNLYRLIRPDLIVFEHSPTALLASRGGPAKRALIGTGFSVPPDMNPFPPFEVIPPSAQAGLQRDEQRILVSVNRLLNSWGQQPLQQLGQLYSQVDEIFLATFPQLDHYRQRQGNQYLGPINATGGIPPCWPDAPGKKVYAYLKRSPAVGALLTYLKDKRIPSLIYIDGIPSEVRRRFASATLRLENQPVDLSLVAQQCDLAITNSNHNTTAALLMAGKPLLLMPLALEQMITARTVERLGAGRIASAKHARNAIDQLEVLLSSEHYRRSATAVAEHLPGVDPVRQHEEMLQRLEQLLPQDRTTIA